MVTNFEHYKNQITEGNDSHRHLLLKENSCIKAMEGAKNNLPDADAHKAAEQIQLLASELTEKDLLLVLISGKHITSCVKNNKI